MTCYFVSLGFSTLVMQVEIFSVCYEWEGALYQTTTNLPYHGTFIPWMRATCVEIWNRHHFQRGSSTKVIKTPFVSIPSLQMENCEINKINYFPGIPLEVCGRDRDFMDSETQCFSPKSSLQFTDSSGSFLSSRKISSEHLQTPLRTKFWLLYTSTALTGLYCISLSSHTCVLTLHYLRSLHTEI